VAGLLAADAAVPAGLPGRADFAAGGADDGLRLLELARSERHLGWHVGDGAGTLTGGRRARLVRMAKDRARGHERSHYRQQAKR